MVQALTILSRRQLQITRLTALGLTEREIAQELGVSYNAVKQHKKTLYKKIDVHSVGELTIWAVEHGIATEEEVLGG